MAQLPSEVTHVVLYTMKEGVLETWVQNLSHGISGFSHTTEEGMALSPLPGHL